MRTGRALQITFVTTGGFVTGLAVSLVGACRAPDGGASSGADGAGVAAPAASDSVLVELPDAGTRAAPGALCARPSDVYTPGLGRVRFDPLVPDAAHPGRATAHGFVEIDPGVLERVVDGPVVRAGADITEMRREAGGFRFLATWSGRPPQPCGPLRVDLVLPLDCGEAGVRPLRSITYVEVCDASPRQDDEADPGTTWPWSNWFAPKSDDCTNCRIIAEMAPSPIVSDNQGDEIPLGRVIQLRVVELSRVGNQVVLFAENDGGVDGDYAWQVSAGSLLRLAPDLVVWTLPEGDGEVPHGQLAVWTEHGAAVENFLWMAA